MARTPGREPDSGTGARPRRSVKRRALLGLGGLLGAGLLGGGACAANFALVYQDRRMTNLGELDFANPLAIPPLLEPDLDERGRRHFRLEARTGTSELLPGKQTPTWGVNGAFLAPTLRARRGETVAVSFANRLPETTTLHWHGMHLPAEMDGGPHQMVAAGGTWQPHWEIVQPAATLWYHPHPHGETADHVLRGIAGLFIIDDEAADEAGLPGTYGVDDVPLIVQDRAFRPDGAFDLRGASFRESITGAGTQGVLGDTILVNGTYDPHFEVGTTLVRFRLLNGAPARPFRFGFTDDREFQLVAQENGLLERPVPLRRLQLVPGERAEIVVAFKPGERVVLRGYPAALGLDFPSERLNGGEDSFDLLELRAAEVLEESPALPPAFAGAPAAPAVPKDARVRRFRLSGNRINGEKMDMRRVDEVVPAGAVEIWEVSGQANGLHSLHVHGATFEVLDYDGRAAPPELRGPKDTVRVPPGGTARLAVALPSYTDPLTPYMYHCHILRHEDRGMMGQFTVVEPGGEDDAPRKLRDGGGHARH
jgi:FtsP/CotA-like multicopper oxidase with cupredoxin domain